IARATRTRAPISPPPPPRPPPHGNTGPSPALRPRRNPASPAPAAPARPAAIPLPALTPAAAASCRRRAAMLALPLIRRGFSRRTLLKANPSHPLPAVLRALAASEESTLVRQHPRVRRQRLDARAQAARPRQDRPQEGREGRRPGDARRRTRGRRPGRARGTRGEGRRRPRPVFRR